MSDTPRRTSRDALGDRAIALVAGREGIGDLAVTAVRDDRVTDQLLPVHRFFLGRKTSPNSTYEVVLDAFGRELELADLRRRERRDVLGPAPVIIDRRRLRSAQVPGSVTIDPTANDLVLELDAEMVETISVVVPRRVNGGKVDIYLLSDTTGTMRHIIETVQASSRAILTAVGGPGLDIAWGVGGYQDFTDLPLPAFTHQLSPTPDLAPVEAAIGGWTVGGGGDLPEGQLYALDRIARDADGSIGWRPGAKRIVVWFGDEPGHEPICPALTGLAAEITVDTVRQVLQDLGITVIAISTNTGRRGLDGDPTLGVDDVYRNACGAPGGQTGQATKITSAAGGVLLSGVDATGIANAIIDTLNQTISGTVNVHLDPTGQAAAFVSAITPGVHGPLPADREHTLPFRVTFRGTVPCSADGPLVFTGRIAVVVNGDVVDAEKTLRVTVPTCPVRVTGHPSAAIGRRNLGPNSWEEISVVVGSADRGVLRFKHQFSPTRVANWSWENVTAVALGPASIAQGSSPFVIAEPQDSIARSHDTVHVLVADNNHHLRERVWDGVVWGDWTDHGIPAIGAAVTDSPAACLVDIRSDVIDPDQPLFTRRLVAFAWGRDGLLYRRDNQAWAGNRRPAHGPTSVDLASGPGSPIFEPAVGGWARGYAFVVGNDRRLYARHSTGDRAANWFWQDLQSPDPEPSLRLLRRPGTAWYTFDGADRLYTFVGDTSGRLFVNVWLGTQADGGHWADQGLPPGTTVAGPASVLTASTGGGRQLYAFVRGANGRLYCNWWDAANRRWVWDDLGRPAGAPLASDPAAVAWAGVDSDVLLAFARDNAGHLQMCVTGPLLRESIWQRLG